jgi:hypothetical protein
MENQFDLDAKNFEKESSIRAQEDKVLDMFSDKSFKERYNTAKGAADMTSLLTNLVSISTFSFLIGFLVYQTLLAFVTTTVVLYIAIPIGLLVGICFELIKNAAYKNFLISLYKYKRLPFVSLIVVALLSLASVTSSFIGATLMPSVTFKNTNEYDFSSYDNQKNILLSQLQSAEKGRFTKEGAKQIEGIEKQLNSLANERVKYAEIIDKKNESFNSEKKSIVSYLGYFSIFSEIVYILCYAFSFYCLYRTYIELKIKKSEVNKVIDWNILQDKLEKNKVNVHNN